VTLDLLATPSALSYAEHWVARVLPAWGGAAEHGDAAQAVTRALVRAAVKRQTAALIALALVRHADGIIVEICEAITWSPGAVLLLSLPQPCGLHCVTTPRADCAAGCSGAEPADNTTSAPDTAETPGGATGTMTPCRRFPAATDVPRNSGRDRWVSDRHPECPRWMGGCNGRSGQAGSVPGATSLRHCGRSFG